MFTLSFKVVFWRKIGFVNPNMYGLLRIAPKHFQRIARRNGSRKGNVNVEYFAPTDSSAVAKRILTSAPFHPH